MEEPPNGSAAASASQPIPLSSAATTMANGWGRIDTILLVLCGAGITVAAPFDRADWPQWAKHVPVPDSAVDVYLAVVAVVSVWLLYRGCRLGARFGDRGVTVRKLLRTYRFGWPQVSRFEDGSALAGEGKRGWALDVVLRDGQVITTRLGWWKPGSPKTLTAVRQVAERYQIPAELTGTALKRGSPANAGRYADPGGQPGTRYWSGKQWSPFLQPDPACGGQKGELAPGEAWAPLPGSEQQWHDAASQARRAGIKVTVWLVVMAVAMAVTVVLYTWEKSKPHASYALAWYAGLAAFWALVSASRALSRRKNLRKIDEASKAAAGLPIPATTQPAQAGQAKTR